ncbi:hypothetical protein GQX74_015034 [Glossina fuscipes]|uniref:Uncharacterized protein n=1 Tax=Glossina palpalis gambiensis TaxID=67801 RepID=A0A1B0BWS5_9MUSC|nr:hypothetical protein GQX74_015034 [Glossina fuscipes]
MSVRPSPTRNGLTKRHLAIIAFVGSLGSPRPALLTARIRNSYCCPFLRSSTVVLRESPETSLPHLRHHSLEVATVDLHGPDPSQLHRHPLAYQLIMISASVLSAFVVHLNKPASVTLQSLRISFRLRPSLTTCIRLSCLISSSLCHHCTSPVASSISQARDCDQ